MPVPPNNFSKDFHHFLDKKVFINLSLFYFLITMAITIVFSTDKMFEQFFE